ncbi:uncharacterized protein LOC144099061 isoform X2 [Amblyomma americanum]
MHSTSKHEPYTSPRDWIGRSVGAYSVTESCLPVHAKTKSYSIDCRSSSPQRGMFGTSPLHCQVKQNEADIGSTWSTSLHHVDFPLDCSKSELSERLSSSQVNKQVAEAQTADVNITVRNGDFVYNSPDTDLSEIGNIFHGCSKPDSSSSDVRRMIPKPGMKVNKAKPGAVTITILNGNFVYNSPGIQLNQIENILHGQSEYDHNLIDTKCSANTRCSDMEHHCGDSNGLRPTQEQLQDIHDAHATKIFKEYRQ